MFLCVPDSYVERMEIMSTLCGSEKVEKPFKKANVTFLTSSPKKEEVKSEPKKEEKKEEAKAEPKKEEKKEEVKSENVRTERVKREEVKVESTVENAKEEVVEEVKVEHKKEEKTEEVNAEVVEPTAELKPVEDAITMEDRKICPVKIVPTSKAKVDVKIGKSNDDEGINAFKVFLEKEGIKYSNIKRVNTGLVELLLPNSTILSVDINDRIYGIGRPVAFIGKLKPLDEYNRKGFILNKETVDAVKKNKIPDAEYLISEDDVKTYIELDINTLPESDFATRRKVIEKAHDAINLFSENISKEAAGTPTRFAFDKYKSIDDFYLVSSSNNKISALCNDTLRTDRVIPIKIKGSEITINPK